MTRILCKNQRISRNDINIAIPVNWHNIIAHNLKYPLQCVLFLIAALGINICILNGPFIRSLWIDEWWVRFIGWRAGRTDEPLTSALAFYGLFFIRHKIKASTQFIHKFRLQLRTRMWMGMCGGCSGSASVFMVVVGFSRTTCTCFFKTE